jgi:hypothetical protein
MLVMAIWCKTANGCVADGICAARGPHGKYGADAMPRLLRGADWDVDRGRDDARSYVIEQLGEPEGVFGH